MVAEWCTTVVIGPALTAIATFAIINLTCNRSRDHLALGMRNVEFTGGSSSDHTHT